MTNADLIAELRRLHKVSQARRERPDEPFDTDDFRDEGAWCVECADYLASAANAVPTLLDIISAKDVEIDRWKQLATERLLRIRKLDGRDK